MGDRAVLLEVGSLDEVLALHAALAASGRTSGVVDLVPAARTVLVRVDPRAAVARGGAGVDRRTRGDGCCIRPRPRPPPAVELDVVYDGADLDETAALLGVRADELVRAARRRGVDGRVHGIRAGLRRTS